MAKVHNNPNYKHGLYSGWDDYRYGQKGKPIRLAGPKFKPDPIYRGDKRKHMISEVMDILKDWRKSPFENEGATRAGLRSAMCEKGYQWTRSDIQAAEIVAEALRLMGAKRPDWEQGQAGYALSTDYCVWCYCPIDESDRSPGRRFCSVECARSGVEHMSRKTTHHYGAVLRSAIRLIDRDKAEARDCTYCAKRFKTDAKNQRFCSSRCAGLYQAGDRILRDRPCAFCHETYRPIAHSQKYCSQSCSRYAALKAQSESLMGQTRLCKCCGISFQPKVKASLYCSLRCQKITGNRAYAERQKVPVPARDCEFCGDIFQPKIHGTPRFCGKSCAQDADRFAKGTVPRKLTRRLFDHYFARPGIARYDRLTPAQYDWMLIEGGLIPMETA